MTALTDSLDSDSEMQPNEFREPVKPRRCRKHVWGNKTTRYRMQPIGEPENITTCIRCGRLQDLALSRRGKSSRRLGSADWPPPNGAYHWEWCKRVNTRGMNAKCDCGGPEAKARAERDISSDPVDGMSLRAAAAWYLDCPMAEEEQAEAALRQALARDISSVTGSGWDGWPERGSASREFRQRVEAMTRQVLTEKPKWSGSMCMTEAERRVLAAIQREAVALAGHRIDEDHDCLVMNCRGLGPEVERLREQIIDEQLRLGVERK